MRQLLVNLGYAAGLVLLIPYTLVSVCLLAVVVVGDQLADLIDRHR